MKIGFWKASIVVGVTASLLACDTSSRDARVRSDAPTGDIHQQAKAIASRDTREGVKESTPAGPIDEAAAKKEAKEDANVAKVEDAPMPSTSRRGLVRKTGEHTALVLIPKVEAKLGKGDAVSIERHTSSYKPADMDALDASYKALIGESIVFEGMDGEVCRGKVVSLAVHAQATAHYSNRLDWDGDSGMPDARRHTDEEVASAIYDMAADVGTSLVALTDAKPSDCEGAAWGHHEDVRIVQYQIKAYDAPEQFDEELAAFKKLPGYLAMQKEWTSRRGGKGPWYEAHDRQSLKGYRIDGGSMRYTLIQASASPDDCDSFEGEFWALYLHTDEALVLLSDGKQPGSIGELRAATDSDEDGMVELIMDEEILSSDGARTPKHRVDFMMETPNFDCAC